MRRVLLCLALFFASKSFANSKSLFVNGVYAATYGDVAYDKGDWRGNNFSAIRLKAGIQLLRIDFVSLTLGYQKVGFYDGLHEWSGTKKLQFDYRGPLLELHLFPDAPFGFSFSAMNASGYSVLKTKDDFKFSGCLPGTNCSVLSETSSVDVVEFAGYVTAKISYGLQAILGIGSRNVTGDPRYDVIRGPDQARETGNVGKWKESSSIILLGIRGTNL